jgi:hypothetical protein
MIDQYLIISEFQHFLITLGIALILYARFRDWRLIPACFLTGFLIDADHWLDYFIHFGLRINLNWFFHACQSPDPPTKNYVLLHGWEFVPIFWWLGHWWGKKKKIKGLAFALSIAYLGHLVTDHFSFEHHPLAYSLLFRLFSGFSADKFNGL